MPLSRHLALRTVAVAGLAGCAESDPEGPSSPPPATPTAEQADIDPAPAPSPGSTPAAEGGDRLPATPGAGAGGSVALLASCRLQPESPAYTDAAAPDEPRPGGRCQSHVLRR